MKSASPLKSSFFLSLILSLALIFGLAHQSFATRIIDENFECTGYEETWIEVVESGNPLDLYEDAPIPGAGPGGAGSQCLKAVVLDATDNNDAYAYQSETPQNISYVRGFLYVDQEGLNEGQLFFTLGLYNGGLRVAGIEIGQSGGVLKLRLTYFSDGMMRYTPLTPIAVSTWYRVEYKYDIPNLSWAIKVNGTVGSGALVNPSRTPNIMVTGIFGHGGASQTTLYTDKVTWGDQLDTTHYVNADNLTPQSPYDTTATAATTIQVAVSACSTGTVYVRKVPSLYGNFTMKSNVDVIGTDESWVPSDASDFSDHPSINGGGMSSGVTFGGPLSHSTLDGFIINGGWIYGGVYVNGLSGAVTNATINHCKLLNAPQGAIVVRGAASPTVTSCDISTGSSPGALGSCITSTLMMTLQPTGSPMIIKGNTLHSAARGGIFFQANNDGGFKIAIGGSGSDANQIYDNGYGGIYLTGLGANCDVTIDNNEIYNNGTFGGNIYGGIRIYNVRGGASSDGVVIQRNTIRDNNRGGIRIDADSEVIVGAKSGQTPATDYANDIYGNYGGVFFSNAVTGDFAIRGNYIHNNSAGGGIQLGIPSTTTIAISQNDIAQNQLGGIGIKGVSSTPGQTCTLTIDKNNIRQGIARGGIHTGDNTGSFSGDSQNAVFTIKHNKVHHNSNANYGGGIDVRYASGTIENNLVYRNARGGIRFGDYITQVINNTVVHNGQNDRGGGIIYDDPTDNVSVNDPPTGTCSTSPLIKNNIVAYSEKAGIRVGGSGYACPADNTDYDYNLLYANYPWNDVFIRSNSEDCGWPSLDDMSCTQQQYGGCGAYVDSGIVLNNPNDIMADPEFVDEDADNYHLQPSVSPAENAGEGGVDMGAYGGGDPMVDSEIPQF